MKILWVTSEATPYAKTGGLADVSGALPEALAKRGHQVTVFMPYYRQQMGKLNLKFTGRLDLIGVPFGPNMEWAGVNILKINSNLTFMFLEYDRFFDRPGCTTGADASTTTTPSGSRSSAARPWRSPCS